MLHRRPLLAAAAAFTATPQLARAAWPERTIRLMVPFTAGGNADIQARLFAEALSARLNQPVVIDNRPGAGGSLGADLVAKATPDGYSLLFGSGGPLVANPVLQARIPYDVARDFRPIGMIGYVPLVCQVGPRLAVRSMTEFLAALRTRPGQVSIATPGSGSAAHLALELLFAQSGLRGLHVPYRGGSALIPDLIAGNVDATLVELSSSLPLHRDGKALIVGIAALERSALVPEAQTFTEAGLTGFTAGSFGGLLAPAGTPEAAIATLRDALAAIIATPAFGAALQRLGIAPATAEQGTPEGFGAFLRRELDEARRAAGLANLRPE